MLKSKNLISVIDIGTTKITTIVAKKNFVSDFEVLGIGSYPSKGIKAGAIINLEEAKSSIINSVELAEKASSEKIKNVFVSLNSSFLTSEINTVESTISNQEIEIKELNKILLKTLDIYNKQEMEVIHTIPYEYIIDGNRGITNPLGLYGRNLKAFFHNICVAPSYINNIENCLTKAQLNIEGYVATGYASSLSCLNEEEKELGFTVIEIGGGSSTISVYNNGNLIYTDGIPYGGVHITSDIAKILHLDLRSAEKMKNLGAISDYFLSNDDINIEENNISVQKSQLNEIIKARVEEILRLLKEKLKEQKMIPINNKIAIAGGSNKIVGLEDLTEKIFETRVKIANPYPTKGIPDHYMKGEFCTAIGMLKAIFLLKQHDKKNLLEDKKSIIKTFYTWLKDNF